jgi:CO/xanthine dehydrogenase Mo-binding subunit
MIPESRAQLVGISLRIEGEVAKQKVTESELAERIGMDPATCRRKLALRGDSFSDQELEQVRDALRMPARWPYTARARS